MEVIVETFIPAFLFALLLGFLYRKFKPVRDRINEINEAKRDEKEQRIITLHKGLLDTLFKHQNLHAYVADARKSDTGKRVYVIQTDSRDNVDKIVGLQEEICSVLKCHKVHIRKAESGAEHTIEVSVN